MCSMSPIQESTMWGTWVTRVSMQSSWNATRKSSWVRHLSSSATAIAMASPFLILLGFLQTQSTEREDLTMEDDVHEMKENLIPMLKSHQKWITSGACSNTLVASLARVPQNSYSFLIFFLHCFRYFQKWLFN